MDPQLAHRFAQEWVTAWNSHDLDQILSHYTDDVVFSSPYIISLLGKPSGEVAGKEALRDYWRAGLAALPDLRFTIDDVRCSVDTIVINYRNERGGAVAEVLRLRDGLVFWGCGAYETSP